MNRFNIGVVGAIACKMSHNLSLKKNLNAFRPSEHPPVRKEKMSKRLGGIIGCKDQNLFMKFNRVPRW